MPPLVEERVTIGTFVEKTINNLNKLVEKENNADILIDYSIKILNGLLKVLIRRQEDWKGFINVISLGIDSLTNDRKIKKEDEKLRKVLSHIEAFKAKLEILIESEYFSSVGN